MPKAAITQPGQNIVIIFSIMTPAADMAFFYPSRFS